MKFKVGDVVNKQVNTVSGKVASVFSKLVKIDLSSSTYLFQFLNEDGSIANERPYGVLIESVDRDQNLYLKQEGNDILKELCSK